MKRANPRKIAVIAAAVIGAALLFNVSRDLIHDRTLENILSGELAASKVSGKDLVGKVKHVYIEKRYWVNSSFSADDFGKRLQKSLDRSGFKLLSTARAIKETTAKGKTEAREEISFLIAERSSNNPIFRLTFIRSKAGLKPSPTPPSAPATPAVLPPEPKPTPSPAAKPEISRPQLAIVLDDWGYNTKNLDAIFQVNKPLTLSVLPDLPYSAVIAQKAKEHGFEVIIHMPMEPKAKIRLELTTLYTAMSDDEIRANLAKALQSIPEADGISNHEGSKATEDRRLMRVVFGELKKNNMFLLDSLVTNYSVCESVAKETGVKFVKRSIFLDNDSDPVYIKKQFDKAIGLALKNGYAVAIGHDRPNTIAVLREMIPAIEEKGIEITYVSNLAR